MLGSETQTIAWGFFWPWDTHFRISCFLMCYFLSVLDFRTSLEDFVQLRQYLASQKCPFEAHSVHARALHCHVIPPSYRGRRDKPWGKGTQTIPCFFKMESIKRRLLLCTSGSDLISGDCRAEMVSLLWVCKHQRSSDPAEKTGNVCGQVLALLICAVGVGTSLRVSKQSVKLWRKWIF